MVAERVNHDLFRHEALDAKSDPRLGRISLAQPLRLWVLAVFAFLAAAAVTSFLVFGEYSKRSRVMGQLIPSLGLSTVVAPAAGVVGRMYAEEGEMVEAGKPLLQIQVPRFTASGDNAFEVAQAEIAMRDASVERLGLSQIAQVDAQIAGASRQLETATHELRQIEQAIVTREQQIRLAQSTVERYRSIAGDRYVSQLEVDQQEQMLLEMINQKQSLERQRTAMQRGIAQMEQSLRELPAQRAGQEAIMVRDRASLRQERVQQATTGELLLTAPVGGLVASRLIEPGQAVQAGQQLLSLLPQHSQLQAQLLVPSKSIGFIEPGDTVLLRYQAYPHQKFGHYRGRVARISRHSINPGESAAIPNNTFSSSEPHYRVLVTLDAQTVIAYGQDEQLKPGMTLEADILGDTRKLYEWLLEPLYTIRGRIRS